MVSGSKNFMITSNIWRQKSPAKSTNFERAADFH
jgi:hypothetical protein